VSCRTGKIGYASPQEAARVVRSLSRRKGARGQRLPSGKLVHYRCHMCGRWHVGHELPRSQARAA